MKKELLELIDLKDASYYVWKNRTKKKLIEFFHKYFSASDLKQFNETGSISKLEYLNSSTTISIYSFYYFFQELIKNDQHLNSLVLYLINYKKTVDLEYNYNNDETIEYDYFKLEKSKKEFIETLPKRQAEVNIYDNFDEFAEVISDITINEFLFIHYNLINNFKLMIELLDKNEFFEKDINKNVKDNLYRFLIKYYVTLFKLKEEKYIQKTNEATFKKIKKYCDKNFNSDKFVDILIQLQG